MNYQKEKFTGLNGASYSSGKIIDFFYQEPEKCIQEMHLTNLTMNIKILRKAVDEIDELQKQNSSNITEIALLYLALSKLKEYSQKPTVDEEYINTYKIFAHYVIGEIREYLDYLKEEKPKLWHTINHK